MRSLTTKLSAACAQRVRTREAVFSLSCFIDGGGDLGSYNTTSYETVLELAMYRTDVHGAFIPVPPRKALLSQTRPLIFS